MKILLALLIACIPLVSNAANPAACEDLANEIVQATQDDEEPIFQIADLKVVEANPGKSLSERRRMINSAVAWHYQVRRQSGPYPRVQDPLPGNKRLVECTGLAQLQHGVWFVYMNLDRFKDGREFWQLIPLFRR